MAGAADRAFVLDASLRPASGSARLSTLALPFLVGLTVGAPFGALEGDASAGLALAMIAAPLATLVAAATYLRRRARSLRMRPATMRVEREALVLEGRQREVIPLSDIAGGWTEPLGDRWFAVLELRSGGVLEATTRSEADAEQLLRAVHVMPERRAFAVRAGGMQTFWPRLIGVLAATLALPLGARALAWVLGAVRPPAVAACLGMLAMGAPLGLALCCVYFLIGAARSSVAYVGTDGVLVPHFGFRRYVPFRSVSSIRRAGDRVLLELDDRRRAFIRTASADDARMLVTRLDASRRRSGGDGRQSSLAALDRGGRPLEQWRVELVRLARGEASYRVASLDREDLLRVIEDPTAPVERRVGAATALSDDADDTKKRRVRVAIDACVEPRLRMALEKASAGVLDENAIGEAQQAANEPSAEA